MPYGEANYSDVESIEFANSFDNDQPNKSLLLAGGEGLGDSASSDGSFSSTTTASFTAEVGIGAVQGLDVTTAITDGNQQILLASSAGKLIRFNEEHVRHMGRTARGVRGMKLKKGEKIISLMIADNTKTVLCVSENGYGKKTNLDDFPSHNRGGQGVISMKTSERNGAMVSSALVNDDAGIMLISDKGTMIRTSVSQIPTLSRNTQGVKVITPKEGEKLIECVTIPDDGEDDDAKDGASE